jgi:hypothetical protein
LATTAIAGRRNPFGGRHVVTHVHVRHVRLTLALAGAVLAALLALAAHAALMLAILGPRILTLHFLVLILTHCFLVVALLNFRERTVAPGR